jgi:hypothetical protein
LAGVGERAPVSGFWFLGVHHHPLHSEEAAVAAELWVWLGPSFSWLYQRSARLPPSQEPLTWDARLLSGRYSHRLQAQRAVERSSVAAPLNQPAGSVDAIVMGREIDPLVHVARNVVVENVRRLLAYREEYTPADAAEFPPQRLRYYQETERELAAEGVTVLGDIEDLAATRLFPATRAFYRFGRAAGGAVVAQWSASLLPDAEGNAIAGGGMPLCLRRGSHRRGAVPGSERLPDNQALIQIVLRSNGCSEGQ